MKDAELLFVAAVALFSVLSIAQHTGAAAAGIDNSYLNLGNNMGTMCANTAFDTASDARACCSRACDEVCTTQTCYKYCANTCNTKKTRLQLL